MVNLYSPYILITIHGSSHIWPNVQMKKKISEKIRRASRKVDLIDWNPVLLKLFNYLRILLYQYVQ